MEGLQPSLAGSDALRSASLAAIAAIASRCSDSGSMDPALSYLLDLLLGKSVKLAAWEQRAAVLTALGSFKAAPLAAAGRTSVASKVIDALTAFLAKETHEQTQSDAAMLMADFAPFVTAPSAAFLAALKEAIDNPKTKHPVALGSLLSAHAIFAEEGKVPFVDSLVKFLERLPSLASHTLVASEACVAAHLLLRASLDNSALLPKLQSTKWWTNVILS